MLIYYYLNTNNDMVNFNSDKVTVFIGINSRNQMIYAIEENETQTVCISPGDSIFDILGSSTNWQQRGTYINNFPPGYNRVGFLIFGQDLTAPTNYDRFYFVIHNINNDNIGVHYVNSRDHFRIVHNTVLSTFNLNNATFINPSCILSTNRIRSDL